MKKVVNLSLREACLNSKIVMIKQVDKKVEKNKSKSKIRNNPKRKGRVYND